MRKTFRGSPDSSTTATHWTNAWGLSRYGTHRTRPQIVGYGWLMALRCGHCGREDTRESKGSLVLSETHDTVTDGALSYEIGIQKRAQIDICSGCGKPTLLTYTWVDEFMDPTDVEANELYPERRELDDLPERVRRRYGEMLEVQHLPDAFAVRAGKTLESVCTDQGVVRTTKLKDLADRLDALVERGDVPQPLADQAHITREYRNLGSHDAELEVRDADVPLIRRFVEGMLDFLYWGPASLARLTEDLEARKLVAREMAAIDNELDGDS